LVDKHCGLTAHVAARPIFLSLVVHGSQALASVTAEAKRVILKRTVCGIITRFAPLRYYAGRNPIGWPEM
jgi:hypothetical protein